jgi:hypothetical protein
MNSLHNTKASWPISFSELKERRDQCKRRENVVSIIWMVIFFSILFANLPFSKWITQRQNEEPWIGITYGILFFSFLIGNLVVMIWSIKRRLRAYSLQCPECRVLLSSNFMPILIVSGRCPNCGALLVHDHPKEQAEQVGVDNFALRRV